MRICLLVEGSCPYVAGGVSSWGQMLFAWYGIDEEAGQCLFYIFFALLMALWLYGEKYVELELLGGEKK